MKKILALFLVIFACHTSVFAADDFGSDDWGSIQNLQDAWDGQRIIKDADFEKVIQQRTKQPSKKQQKKTGAETYTLPSQNELDFATKPDEVCVTLLVPQTLYTKDGILPMGYYRAAKGTEPDGKHFINFYEGSNLIAKVYAYETQNDYNQKSISYLKIVYQENEGTAKIIYGCLDYNLEADAQLKP